MSRVLVRSFAWRPSLFSIVIPFLLILLAQYSTAQIRIDDPYLRIDAKADDPLFTTYAADMSRSRLYGDKAYFMDYASTDRPITFSSQYAGDISILWRVNGIVIKQISEYAVRPRVVESFPDMAIIDYEPFSGINVMEVFNVYSSSTAIIELYVSNSNPISCQVSVYPVVKNVYDSLNVSGYLKDIGCYQFTHYESLKREHSDLYRGVGYPTNFVDLIGMDPPAGSYGAYGGGGGSEFENDIQIRNENDKTNFKLNEKQTGLADLVALEKDFNLAPGQSMQLRFVRVSEPAATADSILHDDARLAFKTNLQELASADENLYRAIPRPAFKSNDEKIVYLCALNLVRECMMPPEGRTRFNYYVFSRNPIWGWGHGHQVMHESLSMIPYSLMNWQSAEKSQEIFVEQQQPDGLIPYRVGPRGPQTYPQDGIGTTSAPFFSWTNWEIYTTSRDKVFLSKVYDAGLKYLKYLEAARDNNHDGLYEWGPNGMIENVRDDWNVVFQLFAKDHTDTVDISHELDCLDLSCEVANEIHYLDLMAKELGRKQDDSMLVQKFERLKKLINEYMWDPHDRFYYNISMDDHSFEYNGKSLKRKEIIGFLPLWSGVATRAQAEDLVKALTNDSTFWRKFGVPTVSAQDPGYTPFVDCCCHWNGPVWLLWNYMLIDGLEKYGYHKIAHDLAAKLLLAVETQLIKNHKFWESYSPDYSLQASPSNYIWDSIIAKILVRYYSR